MKALKFNDIIYTECYKIIVDENLLTEVYIELTDSECEELYGLIKNNIDIERIKAIVLKYQDTKLLSKNQDDFIVKVLSDFVNFIDGQKIINLITIQQLVTT